MGSETPYGLEPKAKRTRRGKAAVYYTEETADVLLFLDMDSGVFVVASGGSVV